MRVAVTGASGLVGGGVADLLSQRGHSVVAIDRVEPDDPARNDAYEWAVVDVTDYDALAAVIEGCDAIVHLAAIPDPGIEPDPVVHNNNVTGSYNALRAAVQVGIRRICQASSINAIGAADSRAPVFDYFPVDESHPTYNEDPYSLSKWICEQQADSIARRYEDVSISSLRFHWVFPRREQVVDASAEQPDVTIKHLWGYTLLSAAAGAALLSLETRMAGHERFFIVAPDTVSDIPSADLARTYYPGVPVRGRLEKHASFFDCTRAARILGWRHDDW
jgi:nucleoside-diphosphate-sugar epimerase